MSIFCFLLGLFLSGSYARWQRFLSTPLIPAHTRLDYIFPAGASARELTADLQKLGLLTHPRYFLTLAYLRGAAKHLRAGEYLFMPGTTPDALLQQMVKGAVFKRQLTFIEGWTFAQMMFLLDNNPLLVHQLTGLSPQQVMANLGARETYPEGLFFPSTYQYSAGDSDRQILSLAYQKMQRQLAALWPTRSATLPYRTPYEALIAASIIEKEAQVAGDRAQISGVIIRRLQKKMLLQMDSTVIYALGTAYHPPLTRADLKVHNPYNTYVYPGLPPTPIAMPGLPALMAALHPEGGDALYFVARGDGSHQFSATYAEQQAAIAKYLLRKNQQQQIEK